MRHRKKKWILNGVLALAAVLCAGVLSLYMSQQRTAKLAAQREQQLARLEQLKQEALLPAVTPTPVPTPAPLDIPIDFAALQSENADAYGWISVSGTKVDYPLMQHATETDYYLTHTFEHEKRTRGAIYTRNDTARDFSDPCTIVYGHNMKDDSMFGSLHDYENGDFFEDQSNRTITTYTPDSSHTWKIFAAVNYSDVLLNAAFDFTTRSGMQAFLDSLDDHGGQIDDTIPVDGSSRIIVLSTCATGGRSYLRYLVVGVLTEEEIRND